LASLARARGAVGGPGVLWLNYNEGLARS